MQREPPPPEPDTPSRIAAIAWAAWLVPVAAVAALVVCGGWRSDFAGLYDGLLVGQDRWHGLADGRLAWCFDATRGEMRRPLFWLALAAEHALADRPAASVHLTSAVVHVAAAVGAAALTIRLVPGMRDRWSGKVAIAAAAAWALHPLRVEPVACASQQGTVLGGALLAASAVAWVAALSADGGRRTFTVAVGLFVLSLLADPTLCFAPIAMLALTLWIRRDGPGVPAEARRPLTFAWIAAALCLVATYACREPGGGAPALPSSLAAASAIVRPLRATLWPAGLHPGYDAPPGFPDDIGAPLWIDLATAAALVAACIRGVRRRSGLGLALLAYLGLVAGPVLLRRETFGADGDAYAATLPLFVAAGVALSRAFDGVGRARPLAAFAVLAVAVAPLVRPAKDAADAWQDEAALAKSVIDADPSNERALVAMGDEMRRAGAPVADLVHWYGSILELGDWRPLAQARLGAAFLETGDAAGARLHLERAAVIAPWLAPAQFDLGALELREGHLGAARARFEAAARLDAESADAWRLLAEAKDAAGDRNGAASAMRRAAALRPRDAGIAEELRRLEK